MANIIKKIYELQDIGKGVINTLTEDNLLKLVDSETGIQGLEDVIQTNRIIQGGYDNSILLQEVGKIEIIAQDSSQLSGVFNVSNYGYLSPTVSLGFFGKRQDTSFGGLQIFKDKILVEDDFFSKGLENKGDYETNFTARSLVTRQYVDGKTTGSETKINAGTNILVTGNGTTATPYVIDSTTTGAETKINSGTNISVTGVGTIASPYVINNTLDGSETKITNGTNTTVTGNGTVATPYQIAVTGAETKITAGTNTTVTGNGTTATPYVINNTLPANTIINRGWFSGLGLGEETIGTNLTVSGDITVANVTANDVPSGYNVIRCTIANAMANTSYKINFSIECQASTLNDNSRIVYPVWSIVSTTQFDMVFRESSTGTQDLKVHIDVVQL